MTSSTASATIRTSHLLNPANGVTAGRACAAPALVLMILYHVSPWWLLVAWMALSATDTLDGWLARRHGTTSSGAFLDPLADKFLVLGALGALAALGRFSWWPVALLAAREILVSVYRVRMAAGAGVSVPARPLAKAKTIVELTAVGLAFLPPAANHVPWLMVVFLWSAVVLAWVSAGQYLSSTTRGGSGPGSDADQPGRAGTAAGEVPTDVVGESP